MTMLRWFPVDRLFIFAFVGCAFGVVSKNITAKISAKIPSVLFSKSFVVSGFKSFTHFGLVLVTPSVWINYFILIQWSSLSAAALPSVLSYRRTATPALSVSTCVEYLFLSLQCEPICAFTGRASLSVGSFAF